MSWRKCPKCGQQMRVIEGSQRSTRTAVYYLVQCECCLLVLNGCKPKRSKKKYQ